MNRMRYRYRVWIAAVVLAAAVLGVVFYVRSREEKPPVKNGTLVQYSLPGCAAEEEGSA